MCILSVMESLRIKDGEGKTTYPPAKGRLLQIKKKLQKIMQDDLHMSEAYDMPFSVLWDRLAVIAKDVEDRVLAGRPIAEVKYEQIQEAIYQSP